MYKTIAIKLQGVSPLVMHNVRLANPLDPLVKLLKRTTGKRKKTDEDHEIMSRLEFLGGLYTYNALAFSVDGSEIQITKDSPICIPSENLEAALIAAAKRSRKGVEMRAGILIEEDMRLDGPITAGRAFADLDTYALVKAVAVDRKRILRTRPFFRNWSCTAHLSYLPEILNEDEILQTLKIAGEIVGLGDWRPRYGRFSVGIAQ